MILNGTGARLTGFVSKTSVVEKNKYTTSILAIVNESDFDSLRGILNYILNNKANLPVIKLKNIITGALITAV